MARDLSREEDPPSVDDVLDALADADARRIVSALSEPKTASDISEECDIPCRRRTGSWNCSPRPPCCRSRRTFAATGNTRPVTRSRLRRLPSRSTRRTTRRTTASLRSSSRARIAPGTNGWPTCGRNFGKKHDYPHQSAHHRRKDRHPGARWQHHLLRAPGVRSDRRPLAARARYRLRRRRQLSGR